MLKEKKKHIHNFNSTSVTMKCKAYLFVTGMQPMRANVKRQQTKDL